MNEDQLNKEGLAEETGADTPGKSEQDIDREQTQLRKNILKEEDEQDDLDIDLSELSLEDLFAKAQETLVMTPKGAMKWLNSIRPAFFDRFHEEKKAALEKFLETAEDTEEFVFDKEDLADQLNEIVVKAREARTEEKKRIEEEKVKNLKKKEALLETLTSLVEMDETEDSIQQVKDIQKQWKQIRIIPKEKIQELWDKYHLLLDKFYDNHSINIELKELDRKKNLEQKIELTKKVDELANERSLKKSFILLNKFHEEFKNIGPVPKESREGIWQAFKAASDKIYEAKRAVFEETQAKRTENQQRKQLLIEKMSLIAQVDYKNIKEWNDKTKEAEAIFAEWRTIGPVPKSVSDKIWSEFKEHRNAFYNNRKNYFSEDHKRRKANLKLKEDLCKRVESIQDNEDLNETTKEILKIQKDWKKVGPVPDRNNQAIWTRFRAACDHFFQRKEQMFSSRKEEEQKNLEHKNEIIKNLTEIVVSDLAEKEAFVQFKELSAKWNSTGHVPRKDLKAVSKNYEQAVNSLFKKYNRNKEELKSAQLEDHYEHISHAPDGSQRLKSEEQKIRKRLSFLNEEILNMERNLSFFAKSKTADKLLKEFEDKLEKSRSQVERLKSELGVIRSIKRAAQSKDAETAAS